MLISILHFELSGFKYDRKLGFQIAQLLLMKLMQHVEK